MEEMGVETEEKGLFDTIIAYEVYVSNDKNLTFLDNRKWGFLVPVSVCEFLIRSCHGFVYFMKSLTCARHDGGVGLNVSGSWFSKYLTAIFIPSFSLQDPTPKHKPNGVAMFPVLMPCL